LYEKESDNMNIKNKRKKNQQKRPVDYRLEYKLPNWSEGSMVSHKYCSALDDGQAMDIFNEMFIHLNETDYGIITVERYDRYGDKWDNVDIVNIPVENSLI